MLFFWVFSTSIGLITALSVTRVVDNRQLWWLAAWTLAFISFATGQLHLYLTWDVDNQRLAAVVDLMLTLATPITVMEAFPGLSLITVMLIAGFIYPTAKPLGPAVRVAFCLGTGFTCWWLWMHAVILMVCTGSLECM